MNWIEQVIAEFGSQIGIYDLSLGADRSIRLELDDESSFGIIYNDQRNSNEVIVYRSTPVNYLGKMQYKEALGLSHFKKPRQWPLQATCNQKEMTLAFRIPERAFMLNSLEKALFELRDIQKQIEDGSYSMSKK
jgi:hypothetical protein